jgi:hypothetical protein
MSMSKYTLGEIIFATLLGLVTATFTAIAAFVSAIFICGYLFTGEASYSSLFWGPVAALVFGIIAFTLVFRWILHYGYPQSSRE